MIDHFNLPVTDIEKSVKLYQQMLAPLGFDNVFKDKDAYGFGGQHWQFGLYTCQIICSLHIAFIAPNTTAVDEFYKTAIHLDALCNGSPGWRKQYGNYYAAYILDYDGHNIEAVCRL